MKTQLNALENENSLTKNIIQDLKDAHIQEMRNQEDSHDK